MMDLKKVVIINSFDYGSTGSVCKGIKKVLEKHGVETWFFCETWKQKKDTSSNTIYLGTRVGNYLSSKIDRVGLSHNIFNRFNTLCLISRIKRIKPDIVNVHNLHNNYIDLGMFFRFLKKANIPVVWTLHDCWSFTGRCPHFLLTECDRWEKGCHDCPYPKNLYPYSFFDYSKRMWLKKRAWFNLQNLHLVTPSDWLNRLLKNSFFSKKSSSVINNGIDLNSFKPAIHNVREMLNISSDKFIIIGVSLGWSYSKGIDRFNKLADMLPEKYQIVLVGANAKEARQISNRIMVLPKTKTKRELVELYSAADLFVNPTREDNFPTVNLEALACGTPVLTSNVGGCPETIDSTCGVALDFNSLEVVRNEIMDICETKPFSKDNCLRRASRFDENQKFYDYFLLFQNVSKAKEPIE